MVLSTITTALSSPRLLSFWALVFVYLGINLVYKLSGSTGKYSFSPASALALAELIKFSMSLGMVYRNTEVPLNVPNASSKRELVVAEFARHLANRRFVLEMGGLALLYCVNNNTYFWIYLYADAASIQLIKSGSSFISAFIMWIILKRKLDRVKWLAITLQMCGLISVQWDPCKAAPVLDATVYAALFSAVMLTSIASVWNERVVKSGPPLNVCNALLYCMGFIFQVTWFMVFAPADQGFFEGYGIMGVLVVVFNAFIGLAISAVYKYADVIVKLFSTTCVTGILMVLNSFFFEWKPNVVIVAGTIVVFIGTYLYMTDLAPVVKPPVVDLELGRAKKEPEEEVVDSD